MKIKALRLKKPINFLILATGILIVGFLATQNQFQAFEGITPEKKGSNLSSQSTVTYFVKTDGNDTSDCLSWNTACKTIQVANDKVPFGTTDFYNIFVKEGTYTTTATTALVYSSKSNYAIYGGFKGTETEPSQRPKDFSVVTLLDGQNTREGIRFLGGANVTFDRLTVINGQVSSIQHTNPRGGGIYLQSPNNVTLNDITIRDSKAVFNPNGSQTLDNNGSGGCLAVSPNVANLTINRLKLDHCQADKNGGGIYLAEGSSNGSINHVLIKNSVASKGGGLYSDNTTRIDDASIVGNSAQIGGGIYFPHAVTNGTAQKRLLFLNNHADQGSAIYSDIGNGGQDVILVNSIFLKNSGNGAPIEMIENSSNPAFGLYGPTISDNISSQDNGAIHYRSGAQSMLGNSVISYNLSPNPAIGMDSLRSFTDATGGLAFFNNSGGDWDNNSTYNFPSWQWANFNPGYINRIFTEDPLSFALDRPVREWPYTDDMVDRGFCGPIYCLSDYPDFFGAKRIHNSDGIYREYSDADIGAIEYQWAQTYARLDRFQGPGHDGNQQYRKIHLKAFSDSGMTNLLDEDDLPTASDGYFVLRGRGRWNADRPDLAVDSNLFAKDVGPRTFCLTAYGYTSKKITVPTMLRTNAPGFNLTLTGIGNTSTVAGSEDTVNINDLNNVLINFTKTRSQPPDYNQDLPGDANGDDTVDLFDLNAVLTNFGSQGEC